MKPSLISPSNNVLVSPIFIYINMLLAIAYNFHIQLIKKGEIGNHFPVYHRQIRFIVLTTIHGYYDKVFSHGNGSHACF